MNRLSQDQLEGHLADNIVMFARLLRFAGLQVGTGQILEAVSACRAVGIVERGDFYWCLHAVFVRRRAEREIFEQAFHLFWRNPNFLERMRQILLPQTQPVQPAAKPEISRRLSDALNAGRAAEQNAAVPPELEFDAALTWSSEEVLRGQDFEQMSVDELERAKRAIARLRLPLDEIPTRRYQVHTRGTRIDMRATLRSSLRAGPDAIRLQHKRRRSRPPTLVIVCDISGSMSRYSRMLLHFAHALTGDRERVHSFVFGTRLTNISRRLRERDVDLALERVSTEVNDWSGGTRMGTCLHDFNRFWSRRVLAQGAVVLLITDGLDRDAGAGLAREAERLHKSCKRLIWLNPLLRYAAFEPRAAGMLALLPHVDELRPVHNLQSLEALCKALAGPPRPAPAMAPC